MDKAWSLSLHITFCGSALHRLANSRGASFLSSRLHPHKMVLIGVHVSEPFLHTFLNFFKVVPSAWSSKHELWNDFAGSTSFWAAISKQSVWSQFPILAALSTLAKYSFKGEADSDHEHFAIIYVMVKSLWTVGKPIDMRSLNITISAFDCSSSACSLASAILNF